MKWKEAYKCKTCGKIHNKNAKNFFCKCGARIRFIVPQATGGPYCSNITEILEPVIVCRRLFKLQVQKCNRSTWMERGLPPPRRKIGRRNSCDT